MALYNFIGENGSMGLAKGMTYSLVRRKPTPAEAQRWGIDCVVIISPVYCPYSSEQTFSQNWEKYDPSIGGLLMDDTNSKGFKLPFKLSKRLIFGLASGFVVLILILSTFSWINGMQRAAVQRETTLSRSYESLKSELDAFLSKAREQAGVTKAQSATFDKIMLDAVQGRYVGEEGQPTGAQPGTGGSLFSAIAEAYPNLDTLNSSYTRILDTISEGRSAFNNGQQKLQDQVREYDQWHKSGIIHSWAVATFIGVPTDDLAVVNKERKTGQAAYDVISQAIKSNLTAEAFDSGQLESQDFFDN